MKYNKTIEFDSNDNPEIYSIRIANLLNEQGLTQEDLAKMSGVSKSSITAWIFGDKNGKRTEPKILGLNCVAKALGVSVDYLIGNTDVKQLDIKKQEISKYTGLDETSLDFLTKLLSYKVGDCIHYPAENDKELIGMVTCEYDTPTYIVNLLFYNPKIIGLIQSYLCMLNEDNASSYQGDKGSAILFELMLELRKLRDMFQPIYKKEFYKYFNKDGEDSGNNK